MKKRKLLRCFAKWIFFLTASIGLFSSCNENNANKKLYTFTGETLTSYCKNRSEFSIFYRLMVDSGTDKLFSCYGHYTCFLPTDSAFQAYFDEKGITYDSLTTEEKKVSKSS